jgi:cell fate regulator YaaT (PSP1 superfamily)
MIIARIQFAPWDKIYFFSADDSFKKGDRVLVETELGLEIGQIVGLLSGEPDKIDRELKPIKRLATADDLACLASDETKQSALVVARELAEKNGLDMKIVDVNFSYSGHRLNFAFIADGRIDFRDLVKDLMARFNGSIRLTQIGTRDEARLSGDCGPCGKILCCRGFVKDFSSVTSEMAEVQQVVHRGSERISGMCGRLMCCLAYEFEGYKVLAGNLPPLGTKVNVDGQHGVVVGHHILKQSVDVRFPGIKGEDRGIIVEVDLNRHQKKDKKLD